jgi:hypothetical protein
LERLQLVKKIVPRIFFRFRERLPVQKIENPPVQKKREDGDQCTHSASHLFVFG